MILNVSGRTDIVAFYTPWFMKRYQEGFLDVRNPFCATMVSRIYFEDVDAIVFCTKNPIPIIIELDKIKKPMIFQITITPYKLDIEPNVPPKGKIIDAVKKIASMIGKEYVYIRYDPIFLNDKYNLEYHKKAFEHLTDLLRGYTETIIVSFLDDYKNVRRNYSSLNYKEFTDSDYEQIGISFSKSAKKNGMIVQTCCEEKNLSEYGFQTGDCVSHTLVFQLTGKTGYKTWNARKGKACHCVAMVDIGSYNSCLHFCKYCYANYDEIQVRKNYHKHAPDSSLLIGRLTPNDQIKVRKK